ncbi:all0468 [Nostoc sp. PCC 7120 = FACHB-418]|nr:all0468 [Nostoc sp. PCC 7120 = FACHB-418]
MMAMKKTILFTLGLLGLLIAPATAQLGRVWTEFQFYSTDLQNYLKYNLSETLKPLETSSQNALNGATGDLNIPNPIAAGEQVRKDIIFFNSRPDKFENNQAIRSNSVTNEINRYLTRSSVEGTLGKNGQRRMKAKLEDTETSITKIEEYSALTDQIQSGLASILQAAVKTAEAAANPALNAAQSQADLQVQSIKIQTEQSKIISENLYQTVLANQSLQYSNLNLANISQQMEEANRARRVDTSTEAARLLRTTAQIDLFGRKNEN